LFFLNNFALTILQNHAKKKGGFSDYETEKGSPFSEAPFIPGI
jgi:hypothetical protein